MGCGGDNGGRIVMGKRHMFEFGGQLSALLLTSFSKSCESGGIGFI